MAQKEIQLEASRSKQAYYGLPSGTKFSLLDRLAEEKGIAKERKPVVRANRAVKRIEKAFSELKRYPIESIEDVYLKSLYILKGSKHNEKDIEAFSLALEKYADWQFIDLKAGMFLSALVNSSDGKRFVIHTGYLDKRIIYLGYKNSGKDIIVKGDAGNFAGMEMQGGSLSIMGSSDAYTGYKMAGGEILVELDATDHTGERMKGGRITVMGSAGESTGAYMKFGEIVVFGNLGWMGLESIGEFGHGNVFQGKRKIVEYGKVIGKPVTRAKRDG